METGHVTYSFHSHCHFLRDQCPFLSNLLQPPKAKINLLHYECDPQCRQKGLTRWNESDFFFLLSFAIVNMGNQFIQRKKVSVFVLSTQQRVLYTYIIGANDQHNYNFKKKKLSTNGRVMQLGQFIEVSIVDASATFSIHHILYFIYILESVGSSCSFLVVHQLKLHLVCEITTKRSF